MDPLPQSSCRTFLLPLAPLQSFCSPTHPVPDEHQSILCPYNFAFNQGSYKWKHIVRNILCPPFFVYYNALENYILYCTYVSLSLSFLLHCSISLQHSLLIHSLPVDRHLGCFQCQHKSLCVGLFSLFWVNTKEWECWLVCQVHLSPFKKLPIFFPPR